MALAGVIHFALAVWVFRDCFAPGLFPYGRDTVGHDILFFDYGWGVVRDTGLIPLWNHQLFAGWPWVAAAGWTPWYPPHWIALFSPVAFAFTLQYLMHHAWAGFGFTAWGRALGLRFGPAMLGGVLFQISGHFTTLVFPGHLAKFEAIAWMPWVMAAAVLAFRHSSLRFALWAAVCIALQIMTQHAQIVYYTVGLVIALSVWHSIKSLISAKSLRPLYVLILIGLVSGVLALVQLLPAMEMIRVSNRAEGVVWEEAVATSYPPEELVELAWPGLFGSSVEGTYQGRWGERLVSDYLGLITLAGILLALIFPLSPRGRGDKGVRGSRVVLLSALLAGSLVLALGHFTPLYRLLYDWLPGWDRWRSPGTIMCVSTFAACSLAALGWNALIGKVVSRRMIAVVMCLLVIGAVMDQWRVTSRYVEPVGVPYTTFETQGILMPRETWMLCTGRTFHYGREFSNAMMLAKEPSITGYHPIVLKIYERLFQAMEFNNPNLHRLLGVSRWRGSGEQYAQWFSDRISGGGMLTLHDNDRRWSWETSVIPGEMIWSPSTISFEEDYASLHSALVDLRDTESLFANAVIAGSDDDLDYNSTEIGSDFDPSDPLISFLCGPYVYSPRWVPNNSAGIQALAVRYAGFSPLWPAMTPTNRWHSSPRFLGSEERWVVISQLIAPGWQMLAMRNPVPTVPPLPTAGDFREFRAGLRLSSKNIASAWGALWAIHLDGDEVALFAQYRPATVRLGLFVSLVSLSFVLALLLFLPNTPREVER